MIAVTDISLPAYSLRRLLFCLLLGAWPAWAQQLDVQLGNVDQEAFGAQGIQARFDLSRGGKADISVDELRLADVRIRDLKLHCDSFRFNESSVICEDGKLWQGKLAAVSLSLDYRRDAGRLSLRLKNFDVANLRAVGSKITSWNPKGKIDLQLDADRDKLKCALVTRDFAFNTDDFSIAGERIAAAINLTAQRNGSDWGWQVDGEWGAGEAFYSPWYRKAGVRLNGGGVVTPTMVKIDQIRLSLDQLGAVTAGIGWDRRQARVTNWGFVTDPLDLAAVVREWVQPVLDANALPSISATGKTRYAADWSDGELQSFYAGIEGASLIEGTGRLSLTGINTSIPWSRTDETQAELSVAGGKLDDFALGGFQIPVKLHGADVAVSSVTIPFLDGRMKIEDFHAQGLDSGWTSHFSGGIEGVSMSRLTSSMGLPQMAGRMSLSIPDARYANHVLDLGGQLGIDVFDGHILARNLKLIDPLSKSSRVVANVEARQLDLGMLTSAFSFGSILGRLDIDIQGLELQDWKPLAFDARLASSPGTYRRAISRGALIDISSIGGAAGAAAVRAIPAAGFFNTFSYDRIGFGCVLKENVCHMDGIAPENGGYILVEGGGIPAVKVMGYNRSIDWNLLVSRLKAVIAGNTKAVIQ